MTALLTVVVLWSGTLDRPVFEVTQARLQPHENLVDVLGLRDGVGRRVYMHERRPDKVVDYVDENHYAAASTEHAEVVKRGSRGTVGPSRNKKSAKERKKKNDDKIIQIVDGHMELR